jgi:hypothetical protein
MKGLKLIWNEDAPCIFLSGFQQDIRYVEATNWSDFDESSYVHTQNTARFIMTTAPVFINVVQNEQKFAYDARNVYSV